MTRSNSSVPQEAGSFDILEDLKKKTEALGIQNPWCENDCELMLSIRSVCREANLLCSGIRPGEVGSDDEPIKFF